MDVVKAFNSELASLYETKPPISKAKMVNVTKAAMKALKWYKHVVLSVEKFIQRCKPEYKIPGLYVIDSICRQSRHQFGPEKDVFAPRFAKNLKPTIELLFSGPDADVNKVIRVISLWKQNAVFDPDQLEPIYQLISSKGYDLDIPVRRSSTNGEKSHANHTNSQKVNNHEKLDKSTPVKDEKAQQPVPRPEMRPSPAVDNPAFLQSIQELTTTLITNAKQAKQEKPAGIKKLLAADYEYSDESGDEAKSSPKHQSKSQNNADKSAAAAADLLSNPGILQQIQKMQAEREQAKQAVTMPQPPQPQPVSQPLPHIQQQPAQQALPFSPQALPPGFNPSFGLPVQPIGNIPFPPPGFGVPPPNFRPPANFPPHMQNPQMLGVPLVQQQTPMEQPIVNDQDDRRRESDERRERRERERETTHTVFDERLKRKKRSRSRSKSRDRKKQKHRDRSRDGDRSSEKHKRSKRSRSRSPSKSKEKNREKDKDRKKMGLPTIKSNHVAVCSRTLWFGRVSSNCSESDIVESIKDYGETERIDFVPPRGCAYVTMLHRKSAYKILDKLQRVLEIKHKQIKLAWAPNRGVKENDEFKEMWDADKGVTYIPYTQLPGDLTPLLDGGMLDVESLPQHLKGEYDDKGRVEGASVPGDVQPSTSQPIPTQMAHGPPQINMPFHNFQGLPPGFPFPPSLMQGRLPMPPPNMVIMNNPLNQTLNNANIPLPSEPRVPMPEIPVQTPERRSRWDPEPEKAPPQPIINPFQSPPPQMGVMQGGMKFASPPMNMDMGRGRFPFRGGGDGFRGRGNRGGRGNWEPRGRGRGHFDGGDRWQEQGGFRGNWNRDRGGRGRHERSDRFEGRGRDRFPQEEPAVVPEDPESRAMAACGLPTGFGLADKDSLSWYSSVNKDEEENAGNEPVQQPVVEPERSEPEGDPPPPGQD